MNIENLLEVEIENKIKKMGELDPGTEEYAKAAEGVAKLTDRAIEFKKVKEDRKNNIAKNVIGIVMPALSLGVSTTMFLVSLKFEEKGSITTTVGRKILDKLFKY